MRPVLFQVVFILALAVAAIQLALVATRERGQRLVDGSALQAEGFFTNLQPCDVPGVRERVIGRGDHTVAFAGEFTRLATIPWAVGKNRVYLYVIQGAGIARIDASQRRISAGDFLVIPAGVRHAVSPVTATMRAIYVEDHA